MLCWRRVTTRIHLRMADAVKRQAGCRAWCGRHRDSRLGRQTSDRVIAGRRAANNDTDMTVADFDALHGLLQHLLPIVGDDPSCTTRRRPAATRRGGTCSRRAASRSLDGALPHPGASCRGGHARCQRGHRRRRGRLDLGRRTRRSPTTTTRCAGCLAQPRRASPTIRTPAAHGRRRGGRQARRAAITTTRAIHRTPTSTTTPIPSPTTRPTSSGGWRPPMPHPAPPWRSIQPPPRPRRAVLQGQSGARASARVRFRELDDTYPIDIAPRVSSSPAPLRIERDQRVPRESRRRCVFPTNRRPAAASQSQQSPHEERDLRVIPGMGVTGASPGCGAGASDSERPGPAPSPAPRRPPRLPLPTRRASSHRPALLFSPPSFSHPSSVESRRRVFPDKPPPGRYSLSPSSPPTRERDPKIDEPSLPDQGKYRLKCDDPVPDRGHTLRAPPARRTPAHASRMTVEEAVSDACEAVGRRALRPRRHSR